MIVGLITPEGNKIPARIVQLDDEPMAMDFNHPLAGKDLTFEVEIVKIRDATKEELAQLTPAGSEPRPPAPQQSTAQQSTPSQSTPQQTAPQQK